MAEIWGAAIMVGGAVLQGVSASKKAKADREAANEDRRAGTKDEVVFGAIADQFRREQDDYLNQVQRKRKERGLDEFRKFSTVTQYNPGYVNTNRIQVGEEPSIANLIARTKAADTILNPPKPKKKKKSLVSKLLDPAGINDEIGIARYGSLSGAISGISDKRTGAGEIDTSAQAAYEAELEKARGVIG